MSSLNGLVALSQSVAQVQKDIVQTQTELSSGKKPLNAAEAGIVTRLSVQVSGDQSVASNIKQSLDLLAVTDTALASTASTVSRMKDIATQAANTELAVADRVALNSTFKNLAEQVASLLKGATFNNTNLLSASSFMADATVATGNQLVQTGRTDSSTTTLNSAGLDTSVDAAVAINITAVIVAYGSAGEFAARATLATSVALAAAEGKLNIATLSIGTGSDTTEQGLAKASYAIDILTVALDTISNHQSIVHLEQASLKAHLTAVLSMDTDLQNTADSTQDIDETALQAKLQQLSNQQPDDYDLVSQMNAADTGELKIFR